MPPRTARGAKKAPAKKMAPKKSKGLSPKTSKGLTKKRIERKSGSGKRVVMGKESPTVTLQFFETPDNFEEYEIHSFQEDGRWWFIPCAGEEVCPLCDSESENQQRTSYRFAANVWNATTGKVQVLEGPKTLAQQIFYRYQRKPNSFLKRVYDVTKFDTQPVSYNFELAEEDPVSLRGKKPHDLDEYLTDEMKNYYGDDLELAAATLDDDEDLDDEDLEEDDDIEDDDDIEEDDDELDDDEDSEDDDLDDDEDDDLDEDEDEDLDDDDLDDDLDDDDEDDDEDDAPPRRGRRAPAAKKTAAKKAPAKKAAKTTKKATKAAPAKKATKRGRR